MNKWYAQNSKRKVRWAVKTYSQWRLHAIDTQNFDPRLYASDVHNMNAWDKASFTFSLCKFITEVIKVNREEYPLNILKELIYCIQMYLLSHCIFWFILDRSDIVFLDVFYS